MDAAKQEQKPCIQAYSTVVFSSTATHVSLTFSVSFSRHSQTQNQNHIWTFSSLSFSLIRLQPKTLCNETKHKRKLSHSLMQTSMDLLFSSLLFSSLLRWLFWSPLVFCSRFSARYNCGVCTHRQTDGRRRRRSSTDSAFLVAVRGGALPILVLVGRVGRERERALWLGATQAKAEERQGKHSNNRDGQAAKHSNLMFGFSILCKPVGRRRQCRAMTTMQSNEGRRSAGGTLGATATGAGYSDTGSDEAAPNYGKARPLWASGAPRGYSLEVLHKAPSTIGKPYKKKAPTMYVPKEFMIIFLCIDFSFHLV
jgi:hypothetical protein